MFSSFGECSHLNSAYFVSPFYNRVNVVGNKKNNLVTVNGGDDHWPYRWSQRACVKTHDLDK